MLQHSCHQMTLYQASKKNKQNTGVYSSAMAKLMTETDNRNVCHTQCNYFMMSSVHLQTVSTRACCSRISCIYQGDADHILAGANVNVGCISVSLRIINVYVMPTG